MNHPLALILIVAALLAACSSKESATDPTAAPPETSPTILRRGNGGAPGSLDPALAEDIHAFAILADLFEGLVTTDPEGRIIPGVAREWHISEDGLEYRFGTAATLSPVGTLVHRGPRGCRGFRARFPTRGRPADAVELRVSPRGSRRVHGRQVGYFRGRYPRH